MVRAMRLPAEIVLPFPSPSQNELDRLHWAKKRRFRDECCLLIRSWLRLRNLDPQGLDPRRRRVEVTRHGARLLDYGNLVGGFKPILDALRLEGLLVDDSPKWVEEHYEQRQGQDAQGHFCTRIVVSEIPDP